MTQKEIIAIVSETYRPEVNGVANTLGYWVDGLKAAGYAIQVIRPSQHRNDVDRAEPDEQQITTTGLPIPGYPELKFGLPSAGTFKRLWKTSRPCAVYIATEGPLGASASKTARKLGIPVLSGFHTNFQSYSRFYGVGWLEKLILLYLRRFHNKTKGTLVPTKTQQSYLTSKGFQNVSVISRGVDSTRFNPARRDLDLRREWGVKDSSQKVLLYVGRLAHEKNVEQIIKSYRDLNAHSASDKTKLVFVGDGPARDELERACPDAIFAGMRHGDELARYYASADIFLFPSKTDTFGNVVTEAMASRLAVLAYDDAAAKEHLSHRISGMISPLNDDQSFSDNLIELVEDGELCASVRTNAYDIAKTITWKAITAELLDLLLDARSQNNHLERNSAYTIKERQNGLT